MIDRKEELFGQMERALRELAEAAQALKAMGVNAAEFEKQLEPILNELDEALSDD